MKKKKLLFMLAAFDKGGIEKVTLDIVNNLDPNKYDITIYTIWYGGHCQSLVKSHIKVKPFFFKRYVKGVVRLVNYLPPKMLYRLFIRGKYDVEIAAGDGECSKIISGSSNRNSKKISWIHMDVIERGSGLKELKTKDSAKEIYGKFDEIVCVSKVCCDKFIRKFGEYGNIKVVYNPLPNHEILEKSQEEIDDIDLNNDTLNLVSVGRLVEQKGYDRLINCCNKLIHHDNINFQLWIIGAGVLRKALDEQIKRSNLEKNVHLIGFRSNPYKYIKNSDIYISSSRDESFSLVVGEAIILHSVVVSTECAGISEWLGDSEYGLMCENDEEALYKGMKKILTDKDLYNTYKKKVTERAKLINFNSALKNFEAIL